MAAKTLQERRFIGKVVKVGTLCFAQSETLGGKVVKAEMLRCTQSGKILAVKKCLRVLYSLRFFRVFGKNLSDSAIM